MTPEQFCKLPKYAQDEIEAARRMIASQKDEIELLTEGRPHDETIVVDPYGHYVPVGNVTIEFTLGPGERQQLTARIENNRLLINADGPVNVRPEASNAFSIEIPLRR